MLKEKIPLALIIIGSIAVSNCISKVLTKIMNTRIYNYCCEKDIFAINQSGFMDGRRTDDNIFTLSTIINSQIKHKKGKLPLWIFENILTVSTEICYVTNYKKLESLENFIMF